MRIKNIRNHFKAVPYGGIDMGAAVYIDLGKEAPGLFPTLGKPLIFSGVTSFWRTSTVNAAEDIVERILLQEDIMVIDRDFYDLQTRKGGYVCISSGPDPGMGFSLDKLEIRTGEGKIVVVGWSPIQDIPLKFKEVFACLIK